MSSYETVTTGRSKRSTAGNRMRELLEKAHQEDDDELFKEVEDDEEFSAPQEVRDVYLEEFADTDEEIEEDEDAEERAIRKEERRKAKGKGRAIYDPLSSLNKNRLNLKPSKRDSTSKLLSDPTISLLDPTLDPSSMAPSTLLLALRKKRREARRENRSEARRSNLRASTLKTEQEILEKENQQKINLDKYPSRGKRRVEDGPKTQDELIAAALEEEERNKEALRDWLKKEDEKRELRKIGRKRVKGPRLTWVSRTVGRLVELVNEGVVKEVKEVHEVDKMDEGKGREGNETDKGEAKEKKEGDKGEEEENRVEKIGEKQNSVSGAQETTIPLPRPQATDEEKKSPAIENTANSQTLEQPEVNDKIQSGIDPITDGNTLRQPTTDPISASGPTEKPKDGSIQPPLPTKPSIDDAPRILDPAAPSQTLTTPPEAGPSRPTTKPTNDPPAPTENDDSQYTRNYLILSQIPGGLTEEIKLILGDHVEWDEVMYIPSRNRPINRKLPICPFTGLPAKYRHPSTSIPYATAEGYKQIEALLAERYTFDTGGWWVGGEEDVHAEGMEGVEGWWEAVNGGWLGGKEIPEEEVPAEQEEGDVALEEVVEQQMDVTKGKRKRGQGSQSATPVPASKRARGKGRVSIVDAGEEVASDVQESVRKSNSKGRKRS
ncbi:hypothetical protein I302_106491 [Kwoniella bestiolae CBS 10118]|uniref:Vps72/YL1 C-terminal domain-containing protein n=1 Tax=Kwoniella bestiolae CBS 10118 TaxID=1296100 RepID=A0A1B9G1A2_9TREE|nr:hypothetical protein I302_06251 [Kwoniella bestiolae CBS 10118]OCF24790.1 hypothetical protein I302_06251 [Kwoniella bestiolae CBS 10118]